MGSTWRGRYREWLRNHSYVFSWGGGVCIADPDPYHISAVYLRKS
ncbi:Uncharacterised protein [Vibrio cholerae]|nr:Uncharacterised protein [Vibrio cholerae]